jgi:DNA polymerase-3 subunit alpha
VANRSRFDKDANLDKERYHLTLLAKNLQGYKNLVKLVSFAHTEGYYYKPRIDWEILQKYHQGLICNSACVEGEIAQLILNDNYEKAKQSGHSNPDLMFKVNNNNDVFKQYLMIIEC